MARGVLRITLKIDPRLRVNCKADIVCDTVKKCNDCSRIITGKFIKEHKCGYSEYNNCNKYVGKNHKCYLKRVKAKGGYCMAGNKKPCKVTTQLKKEGLMPFMYQGIL